MTEQPPSGPPAYSGGSEPSGDQSQPTQSCAHVWIGMDDHQRCGRCYARNPALNTCRDCGKTYPPEEDWTVFDHSTGLSVRGYCGACGPARAILR